MVIAGPFRSTLFSPIGPAFAQFPARSQTARASVDALAVSVPAGTLVESEKLASDALDKPETASLELQAILASIPCHRPSAGPQEMFGECWSNLIVMLCAGSALPALSRAKYVIEVTPSPVMLNEADAPCTVVEGIGCAPVAEKVISLTPDPSTSSWTARFTVTSPLFQPAAFAAGFCAAVVTGAVASQRGAVFRSN